ncbi:MAG: DUF4402 domain-containing protein [Sphingomonadaceae bacterium]|nr:DUF4402 domain-containing protein [Sphingomonadaceae bacterium]
MINKFRMGAAGAVIAAAVAMSPAAYAQSATATATAEIVKPLVFQKDTDLDFGKIVVAGAGTVVVNSDGVTATSCTGGLTCYSTTSPAEFSVTDGSIGKEVRFDMPAGAIELIRVGAVDPGTGFAAADKIELSSLETTATQNDVLDAFGAPTGAFYYTVNLVDDGSGNGSASFGIGATANLDGSEVEGVYENTTDLFILVEYS